MSSSTKDQVTGIIERVIYGAAMAILTKLVAKGYIDQDMAAYVAGGVVTIAGGAWAWWINRPKALLQSAAAVVGADGKKTLIVASPELAQATPNETNIVSNADSKVVNK